MEDYYGAVRLLVEGAEGKEKEKEVELGSDQCEYGWDVRYEQFLQSRQTSV
jgi:hypothetical protein